MERSYLQVNLPNFLSVLIMGAVGITLVGFIASALRGFKKGDEKK